MRNPMGLSVTDLSCSRGGRPVLDRVSFALADGETLVIRGPNGAGKSTLLRAVAGLLPATGRIEFDGRPADRDTRSEAVAYAGHLDAIKPQLTVGENLAFWAGLLGGDVARALAAFGLGPLADRPAHLCSAGQKRRLGLARLLVVPRRLWLLDEPTVALDSEAVAGLLAAVRAHAAGGGLTIIATHVPLDLAPVQTLTLAPETTSEARIGADPFLTGTWA
jgi:heme exporter protein A